MTTNKLQIQRNAVLVELLSNRAISKNHTYRWVNKRKNLPSLKNDITSSLFCADYVDSIQTENGLELKLTAVGKIIANELKDKLNCE